MMPYLNSHLKEVSVLDHSIKSLFDGVTYPKYPTCYTIESLFGSKHSGRPIGAISIKETIVPVERFPIQVYLDIVQQVGFTAAYVFSCVKYFEPKRGTGPVKPGANWVPSMEHSWPFSKHTLDHALKVLMDSEYISWNEDDRFGTQAGYFQMRTGTGYFMAMPAPRFIPKGRLAEYMILARTSSTKGKVSKVGIATMSRDLHMKRNTVVRCFRDLEKAGAITQMSNHRSVTATFKEKAKKSNKEEGGNANA